VKRLIGLALAIAFASPQPASAHYLAHTDPNDSPRPDMRVVRFTEARDPHLAIIRIRTYEGLHPRKDEPFFDVFIDSRGGDDWNVRASWFYDTGSGEHDVCSVYTRGGRYLTSCDFKRKVRFLRISFKWKLLNANKHVRWRVEGGKSFTTSDLAPDSGGFYEH
jgi:hypothetical protein